VEPGLERSVEILERTPSALRALLAGVSPGWLEGNEGPETFSPRDVLGHLIHGEETDWIPRARLILQHGENRPFTPFDRFGFRAWIAEASTTALLDRFQARREESLQALASFHLQPADLERRGRHPELGRVTLGQLLASWAVHDLGHLSQVTRVMARQYREAVGPWRPYLTILDR
jgi:hypothetical protein